MSQPFKADKLLEGHRDSTHSSPPSSPSDSTLSLQLDGKQFIGLLPHGNALLWFPHWTPATALGQGILAIKLERLCKFPQHMVLYLGTFTAIESHIRENELYKSPISFGFLLARTCPTHPTNLQSLGDKKHWSTTEDTTWDFAVQSAKPLFPLACRRRPGPVQ